MTTARVDLTAMRRYLPFFILPLLGVACSAYALVHFYHVKMAQGDSFACNINQTFNCDTVALSAYSELFGVPMGIYGAAYFVALWVLLGIGVSNHKGARDHLLAYVVMNVLGVLVSLVLAGISHFVLHTWCLSCMGVYAVCLLQLIFLLWQRAKFDFKFDVSAIMRGSTTALVVVVAAIALHSFAKPRISRPVEPPVVQSDSDNPAEMLLTSGSAQTIPIIARRMRAWARIIAVARSSTGEGRGVHRLSMPFLPENVRGVGGAAQGIRRASVVCGQELSARQAVPSQDATQHSRACL